ncbi:MAG: 5-dehydro-2-deoxygluconokinase [Actinomycetota bacterium]
MSYEVIAMGRLGVDLYPLQTGLSLQDVDSFGKFLGGTAGNVAVAAALHGRRVALISRTGDDAFGQYLVRELERLGVDPRYVTPVPDLPTPITFCEIHPPDDFPITFYRYPKAPDMQIRPDELDFDAIRDAEILWITVSGLSGEPSRSAHHAAVRAKGDSGMIILDLDYRADFWEGEEIARERIGEILADVHVVVGNQAECRVAIGESDPEAAAEALLNRGPGMAVVKLGPDGVFARRGQETVIEPALDVEIMNGLGAGDAFGGALCHGLLSGWSLERTIRFANVAGALVASRLECSTAMPTTGEVEATVSEMAS